MIGLIWCKIVEAHSIPPPKHLKNNHLSQVGYTSDVRKYNLLGGGDKANDNNNTYPIAKGRG